MLRENYYDLSVYHVQQCVEKSLKGLLCFYHHESIKTHDLRILLRTCLQYEASLSDIRVEVLSINELDVKFRYPSSVFEPPEAATKEAVEYAELIFEFVKSKIYPPSV
jgi:HEPN domain-containing protein